jgi:hypothetical protein
VVGEQDLIGRQPLEHIDGVATGGRLALAQLDRDRHFVHVDKRVVFGGQAAARVPHALGSSVVPSLGWRGMRASFLMLLPC